MTELLDWLLGRFARLTNRFRIWYHLPFVIAMPTLVGHRVNMREQNLCDTERDPAGLAPGGGHGRRDQREADGSFNDLGAPWMGMAGARFGRNMPIAETYGEGPPGLYEPNPRLVSRKLLKREAFVPVPHLNVLVPAWLQFMVHDWLSHGPTSPDKPHEIPLPKDDDWEDGEPHKTGVMIVRRTQPDRLTSPADAGQPAAYRNTETHWWDGSQIYGSSRKRQTAVRTNPDTRRLRDDGKIHLDRNGMLPVDEDSKVKNVELAGVNGNWWLGLSVMHTLFARE